MCLGVPGQVVEVKDNRATVDFWGLRKCVLLDHLTEPARVGDYVIDHVGFAVRVIAPDDVAETLLLYETVLAEA